MIVEVLDARDPLGCRCLDVERFVRRTDPSKKIILLLNKIGECVHTSCVVCNDTSQRIQARGKCSLDRRAEEISESLTRTAPMNTKNSQGISRV